MKVSEGFTDAPLSWLSSLALCCAPLASCLDRKPRRSKFSSLTTTFISLPVGRTSDQDLLISKDCGDRSRPIVYNQPPIMARPTMLPETGSRRYNEKEKPLRKSSASGRIVLSMSKRFRSETSSMRRPQISGPSEFRHLETGSFQFPPPEPTPLSQLRHKPPMARRSSFRPLELSIYMPKNHMSPILPHFEFPIMVAPPLPTHLQDRLDEDHQLIRQRSNSSTPFHLPRKPLAEINCSATHQNSPPPIIPPKSQARTRAHTIPELDTLKGRVAGAMMEVERLQKQIDDVIERQSLYADSRPSTSHSMVRTMPEIEPMPSIPALPPAAPSFAERLNFEVDRPRTAPLRSPLEILNRSQDFGEAQTAVSTPMREHHDDAAPPPPLPLVLRPPLRKKKSFSRVSTWLFPDKQHCRDISFDSITNLPRPVKGTEGFYQCVPAGEVGETFERRSFDSVGTITTWESEDEQRTMPTTWTPESTPTGKHKEPQIERTATFGRNNNAQLGRASVGVEG